MYKLTKNADGAINGISKDNAFIPFDPANTDYQQFKAHIDAVETPRQLEDADGNLMTHEAAQAFVATLP